MLAAGVDPLSAYVAAGFNSLRLVSAEACRPFDVARDGLSPGEGSAAFVLERADDAAARGAKPLARIEGFGEALDAYHHTRAHPEGAGLVAAARKALAQAGIGPRDIGHAHLHGTGTQANDASEYGALKALFGDELPGLPVCSTKSMTGHTFGGAGALSAAFCLLTLEQGLVPPTLNLSNLDPAFAGLNIAAHCRSIEKPRHVMSLALGFGGEAFALVLGRVAREGKVGSRKDEGKSEATTHSLPASCYLCFQLPTSYCLLPT
jgi:3-oxoacyl-(acyl-carrier-protein) synthase